jgi:hypothetical protein
LTHQKNLAKENSDETEEEPIDPQIEETSAEDADEDTEDTTDEYTENSDEIEEEPITPQTEETAEDTEEEIPELFLEYNFQAYKCMSPGCPARFNREWDRIRHNRTFLHPDVITRISEEFYTTQEDRDDEEDDDDFPEEELHDEEDSGDEENDDNLPAEELSVEEVGMVSQKRLPQYDAKEVITTINGYEKSKPQSPGDRMEMYEINIAVELSLRLQHDES